MHGGAQAQARAVDRPQHHVGDDEQVAGVEGELEHVLGVQLRDDGQHADQRDGDAGQLRETHAVAEQYEARRHDEGWSDRADHTHVDGGGVLQPVSDRKIMTPAFSLSFGQSRRIWKNANRLTIRNTTLQRTMARPPGGTWPAMARAMT